MDSAGLRGQVGHAARSFPHSHRPRETSVGVEGYHPPTVSLFPSRYLPVSKLFGVKVKKPSRGWQLKA